MPSSRIVSIVILLALFLAWDNAKSQDHSASHTVYGQSLDPKILVLEKSEGEKRIRLPRAGVANKSVEFILKITPESAGSKHLVLGTQTIPPGGTVPKHRHLDQDEVVVLQSGSARMTLAGKDYDVHAGGVVFAPANTWMALKNTGTEEIQLIFIYSAPGFERYMRCTSTPVGQTAPPLSIDQLRGGRACRVPGPFEYVAEMIGRLRRITWFRSFDEQARRNPRPETDKS